MFISSTTKAFLNHYKNFISVRHENIINQVPVVQIDWNFNPSCCGPGMNFSQFVSLLVLEIILDSCFTLKKIIQYEIYTRFLTGGPKGSEK